MKEKNQNQKNQKQKGNIIIKNNIIKPSSQVNNNKQKIHNIPSKSNIKVNNTSHINNDANYRPKPKISSNHYSTNHSENIKRPLEVKKISKNAFRKRSS